VLLEALSGDEVESEAHADKGKESDTPWKVEVGQPAVRALLSDPPTPSPEAVHQSLPAT